MLHAVYRDPFSLGSPSIQARREGQSLDAMARSFYALPEDFTSRGEIAVNGVIIPNVHWGNVRPKNGTVITFHYPLAGGGDGGGKQVFGLVAAIALTVVTGGLASGALAPTLGASLGSALGVGAATGSTILAGAVGIAGSLAISALTSPPTVDAAAEDSESGGRRREAVSVEGNLLEPNTPVPAVIGTRRTYPPFAGEPIIELVGQDEHVEAVYVLGGPHELDDIRLGEASVELTENTDELDETNLTDVRLEIRNGFPGENNLTLTTRQGRSVEPQSVMSTHRVDPDNQDLIDDTEDDPLPVFHPLTTRIAPDENWIQFLLAGLRRQDDSDATDDLRIPIRIRMRRRGDTEWRNLPEIHYMNVTSSQVRFQVRIFWGDAFTDAFPDAPSLSGFVTAFSLVPGQDVSPNTDDYEADPYFIGSSGEDYYQNGNEDTTNVRNLVLFTDHVDVHLDEDEWEPGIYDVEVKRGATFRDTLFTVTSYDYDGNTLDFFGQTNGGVLPITRGGLLDRLQLTRFVNIWNEYPIKEENVALIAVQTRNRSVRELSCLASRLTYDLPLGRGPIILRPDGTGDLPSLLTWDEVPDTADTEVLILHRPLTEQEDNRNFGGIPVVRASGDDTSEEGYIAFFRQSDEASGNPTRLELGKFVAGVFSSITDIPFRAITNRNYFIRLRAEGSELKVNAWPATLPEPDGWLIEETDTDISAAGWVGVFTTFEGIDAQLNWFSVGLDGDSAPSPPNLAPDYTTDFSEYGLSGDDLEANDWTSRWHSGVTSDVEESENLPYNGEQTEWSELRATSNPAPHFRDVLTGDMNFDPLPEILLDDKGIRDWWTRCAASDFKCNMVVEGLEITDLLRVVGSCGYGRLYRSELWGVIQDRSRRNDSVEQVFSPRNSSGLEWRKAFSRLPSGFRINLREEENDYQGGQLIVNRKGAQTAGHRLEQVTYDGITNEDNAIRRARFDLLQAERRSTFYRFSAPAESIVCRRGSLIGFSSDVLTRHYGHARVREVISDNDQVTGIVLDAEVDVKNEPDMLSTADVLDVDDMLDVGIQSGVAIRRTTGAVSVHRAANDSEFTDEIEFETPLSNKLIQGSPLDDGPIREISEECLVVIGQADDEYRRLIVSEIRPNTNLEADLICVDEAPEIFDTVFGSTQE